MRKTTRPPFVPVLFLAVLTMAVAAGCSANARQEASHKLLDQVADAEQYCERAVALLANPVYSVNGEYAPVQSPVNANATVAVAPVGTIHPEVWDDLDRAEKLLTAGISEGRRASDEDLAIARMMLGRIYALRGHCRMLEANVPSRALQQARQSAYGALASVENARDLVSFYKSLADLSDADLAEARAQAQAYKARIDKEIADSDQRGAELAKEKEAQAVVYQQKNAEARTRQIESGVGSAGEGLKKLDEALALKTEANKAEAAMAQSEREASALRARRESLVLELSGVEAQIAAADEEIDARKTTVQRNTANASEAEVTLARRQQALGELVAAMAEASEQMAAAHSKAVGDYDKGLNEFRQAGGKAPSAGIKQADALMSIAEARAQDVRELEANTRFLQALRATCQDLPGGLPQQAGRIVAFLPDGDADKAAAVKSYQEAATLYQQAVRGAERDHKWAYLGQVAAAYADLYELDGSAEALDAARQALSEALEGREDAPALKPLKDLQQALAAKG